MSEGRNERRRDLIERLNEKEKLLRELEERRREPEHPERLSEKELAARLEIERSRRPNPSA